MKWKVGDVVVTRRCVHAGTVSPGPVGVECTIIAVDEQDPVTRYETDIPYTGPGCEVWPHWWGCDNCFELRPPPATVRQEVGRWESCVWQPLTETVKVNEP